LSVEAAQETVTWLLEDAMAVTLVGTEGGVESAVEFTVTVTDEETEPPLFVADSVYVVVAVGEIETEPLSGETAPGPGEILSAVAPVVLHDREVDCPAVIAAGLALNALMTGWLRADGVVADAGADGCEVVPVTSKATIV